MGSQNIGIFINQRTLLKTQQGFRWLSGNFPSCQHSFFSSGGNQSSIHLSDIFLWLVWILISVLSSVVSLGITWGSPMHKHSKDCPGMSSISSFGWSIHIKFCSSYLLIWGNPCTWLIGSQEAPYLLHGFQVKHREH